MLRALLIVVTAVSGLAAALLLTLSPRVDYGAFATSCPGVLVAAQQDRESSDAPGTGGDVPVPAVTLGFWIIKILATTLGETGGDTVTMTWLGETTDRIRCPTATSSARRSSALLLVVLVWRRSARAASTPGSIGRRSSPRPPAARRSPTSPTARSASAIPAARCCCSPACCLAVRLVPDARHDQRQHRRHARARRPSTGSPSPSRRRSAPRSATGSPTQRWRLGLRLRRRRTGLRRRRSPCSRSLYFIDEGRTASLFWAAFILTRPLGATVGDFLDKPLDKGGLEFSRPLASAVLAVVICC